MKSESILIGLVIFIIAACGLSAAPIVSLTEKASQTDIFFTLANLRIEKGDLADKIDHINIRDRLGGPTIRCDVITPYQEIIDIPAKLIVLSSMCEYDIELVSDEGERTRTSCRASFGHERIVTQQMIDPELFESQIALPARWPGGVTTLACAAMLLFVMAVAILRKKLKAQTAIWVFCVLTVGMSISGLVLLNKFDTVRVLSSPDNRMIYVSSLTTADFTTPQRNLVPLYINESQMLSDNVTINSGGSVNVKLTPGQTRIFRMILKSSR